MLDAIVEKLEAAVDFISSFWHRLIAGKRGEDDFSGFLWIVSVLLFILFVFCKKSIIVVIAALCFVYGCFRCFSPFLYHDKENDIFHAAIHTVKGMVKTLLVFLGRKAKKFQEADKKAIIEEMKEKVVPDEETKKERAEKKAMKEAYYIFECPGCKQKVRIPNRGKKGRVAIICPACKTRFIRMRL